MPDEPITDRDAAMHAFMEKYLERAAERDLKPYLKLMSESFDRTMGLVQEADRMKNELSNEILRAAVVLNHAYLEDFLRTLALTFLPIADEKTLDGIPLAGGQFDRAEKFSLGKLTRHRGKTVNDLIKESVSAYMERSTFNSVTEIMSFLDSIGLKLASKKNENSHLVPPFDPAMLPVLEKMMRKRHHIVHRADKAKTGEGLQNHYSR